VLSGIFLFLISSKHLLPKNPKVSFSPIFLEEKEGTTSWETTLKCPIRGQRAAYQFLLTRRKDKDIPFPSHGLFCGCLCKKQSFELD